LPAVCSDWHSGVADSMSAWDITIHIRCRPYKLNMATASIPRNQKKDHLRYFQGESKYKVLGVSSLRMSDAVRC
jgi:hypothetical protein